MPLRMFVRFRQQGRRLQPSLMQTRRVSGKIRSEHIASLGSVDVEVSVRERFAFWAKLPERLTRLANRVGPEDHAKIYEALHARIPMVTVEEQRSIQEENAKDDERFWDTLRDVGASIIEGHREIIASAEAAIAEQAPEVAKAAERVEAAKSRLEKIRRGEDVGGGLGKPVDFRAGLLAAGFEPSMLKRCELLASLTKAELKMMLERVHPADAVSKATAREARRIIRTRS
jgi:hypothetical protein